MSDLPMRIQRAASRYKTIETDGLTIYPVLMREYELFLLARPALEVLHQSLPVRLMRIPLLAALYQMDFDAAMNGETPSGLFSRTLLALALSLRLGEELEMEERLRCFRVVIDPKSPGKLLRLAFEQNGEEKEIRPAAYPKLRQIIALQNGVSLESDTANPDIVKAQKDMASLGDMGLDVNAADWISAIAALTGTDEAEIDLWPIRKFQNRSTSFRRILDYLVCGIGEMYGTTWKGGNPNPHPFFARAQNGSGVLSALGGGGKESAPPEAATAIRDATKNLSS